MISAMNDSDKQVKFGDRLHELLEQSGMSQAKLSDRAGVERSTISRIIKGERTASLETLKLLATALGKDVGQVVEGTDAADKLAEATTMVRRQDYQAAIQKMLEFEEKTQDLARKLRVVEDSLGKIDSERGKAGLELSGLQFKLETTERDLAVERQRNAEQTQELKRYRSALQRAVADVSSLRGQLEDLAQELKGAAKSSRTATILAGVAAVAGVVTMASYLATEEAKKQKSLEEPR
jgi:transcriptional regulator with XRE-family HTH domain